MAKNMRKVQSWKPTPRKNVDLRARLSGIIISINYTTTNQDSPTAIAADTANVGEARVEKEIAGAQYFAVKSTLTL